MSGHRRAPAPRRLGRPGRLAVLTLGVVLAVALVAVVWITRGGPLAQAGRSAVPFLPAGVADGPSAAARYDWGAPSWDDEFDGTALNPDWEVYDSPGNGGNGIRSPKQVSVADGVMTQSGTADATTAGMSLSHHDAQFGRWEARVRAIQQPDVQGRPYHVVVALIPVGIPYDQGQHDIDFAETDIANGSVNLFVHYPKEKQDYLAIPLDLSQWHTFAIEVTPSHMTWYVDGVPRATDTRQDAVPVSAMAFNVQLDANQPDGYIPGEVQLDWARYYPLPAGDVPVVPAPEPHEGDYDPNS